MRKFLACSLVGVAVFGGALVACSGGGGGRSQQAFCDALKKDESFFNSLSDASDIKTEQSTSLAVAALDELSSKAPDEIKNDMQKVAQYTKDTLAKKESSVSTQDATAAAANIDKYAKDKCGVDLLSGASSSSSTSSRSSSSSDRLSDLSDLSDLSNFSDLSDLSRFSDLSSLTSNFSDLSSLTNLSSLDSVFSSLFSR
jgi:hypothetical protein